MSAVVDVFVALIAAWYGVGLAAALGLLWLPTSSAPQPGAADMSAPREDAVGGGSV